MKKYIPNILTIFRIILVPVFIFIMNSGMNNSYFISLIIFVLASITDALDGKLARKFGAVSKFGLFMDPLADKILVLSAFLVFLKIDILSNIVFPWMVLLIFSRDFLVTILRVIMKRVGATMVTSKVAKLKTGFQLTSIITVLLFLSINSRFPFLDFSYYIRFFMIIVTFFTVYTGIDYYYKNLKIIYNKIR